MAVRCGYFVADNKIHYKRVNIDWDLGFTKDAKRIYIQRIVNEIPIDLRPVIDVTTASPIYEARGLSPFYVKGADGITNVEDLWAKTKEKLGDTYVPGAFDFLYLNCLSEAQRTVVYDNKTFIDVFHNPDTGANTQAKSLCVLQLLNNTDNLELLKDSTSFVDWYTDNCLDVTIV